MISWTIILKEHVYPMIKNHKSFHCYLYFYYKELYTLLVLKSA